MVGLDPHLLLPMKLLIYAVYRLVRTIILLESDLYTLARRLIQQEKAGNVEFFNIITRYRLDATDVAQDHDFLIFNDGFGTIGDLSDPCWLIYSITERYVYFVRIPDDPPLSMSFTQKLTLLLHNSADRVARIDIKDFSNEAKSRFPASKGRVVMLHNAPCCGGSMLGRLLSSSDLTQRHVLVLGEPPALSALAVLAQIVSIEVMRSVTLASLRYIMRHLESDQVVVMKTRSCCAKIVPYIHATMPSIQHLYITSKDPTAAISRLVTATSTSFPVLDMVCTLLAYSSTLCDFFSSWRLLEPEMVQRSGQKKRMSSPSLRSWAVRSTINGT